MYVHLAEPIDFGDVVNVQHRLRCGRAHAHETVQSLSASVVRFPAANRSGPSCWPCWTWCEADSRASRPSRLSLAPGTEPVNRLQIQKAATPAASAMPTSL